MKFKSLLIYLLPPLLIGCLGFLYGFAMHKNNNKNVKKIEVVFNEGDNAFLTHQTVNKLLIQNKLSVKNQPKRVLDLHGLERKVQSNPFVEQATVSLTVEGVLKTTVKQREPIARVVGYPLSYYIDKMGVEVPLSPNFSARVPLIYGIEANQKVTALTQLMNTIYNDDFLRKEITAVEKKDKEYEFSVRSGNYKILFGQLTHAEEKFKKLKAFYKKAYTDKSIHQYKTINLKYRNQVVCIK